MAVTAVDGKQPVAQVADSSNVQQANQTEQTFNYEATEEDKNMGLVVEGKAEDIEQHANEDKISEMNIWTFSREILSLAKQYHIDLFTKGFKEAEINFYKERLKLNEKYVEQDILPNLNRCGRAWATKALEFYESKEQ